MCNAKSFRGHQASQTELATWNIPGFCSFWGLDDDCDDYDFSDRQRRSGPERGPVLSQKQAVSQFCEPEELEENKSPMSGDDWWD